MFERGLIPPQIHFKTPNPAIHWTEYNMHVPTKVMPLQASSPSGKPLVSICGSGIGGSNGHVLVEGPPISANEGFSKRAEGPVLLVAGGLSSRTAVSIASNLAELVVSDQLPVISNIYGRRARQMPWRTYSVISSDSPSVIFPPPQFVPRGAKPLVYVFSGQGPQHIESEYNAFLSVLLFLICWKWAENCSRLIPSSATALVKWIESMRKSRVYH